MSCLQAPVIKKSLLLVSIVLLTVSLSACEDKTKQTKQLVQHSLQDMAFIKGGTYAMGYGNTKPNTTVKSFYISKYNVSWQKYDSYTELTNQKYALKESKDMKIFDRAKNYPANNLTWYQASNFCEYLKAKTGLPYDLPTAAQWEYVARNGGKLHWDFPTNNGKQELGKNFPSRKQQESQKGNVGQVTSALPVGSLPCTPMGICGMNGEIDVWLKDKSNNNTYAVRGGGAGFPSVENVYNQAFVPSNRQWAGFRCVINSDKPMAELKQQAMQQLKHTG